MALENGSQQTWSARAAAVAQLGHCLPSVRCHACSTQTACVLCFCSCATGINLAFEGTDRVSSAFVSASQVTKLNSYSLVELFNRGKSMFFDVVSCQSDNLTI